MPFSTRDVVRALFANSFGSEPSEQQYRDLDAEIGDDAETLVAVADRMRLFSEGLRAIASGALADHSQHGEFRMMLRHLVRTGTRHGVIVDVGAHGRESSNSYDLLAGFGWRWLLIEANPALAGPIRDAFAGTDFELIGCAVDVEPGRMPFYLGGHPGVSSLIRANAEHWGALGGIIDVEVRRLPDILDAAGIPADFDILSLDIEGADVRVFDDLIVTSGYRPRLVLIETDTAFTAQTVADMGLTRRAAADYRIVDRLACNLLLAPVDGA